jgi:hypothetical protein
MGLPGYPTPGKLLDPLIWNDHQRPAVLRRLVGFKICIVYTSLIDECELASYSGSEPCQRWRLLPSSDKPGTAPSERAQASRRM